MKSCWWFAALVAAMSFSASAHTPYLAPSAFAVRAGDAVALDASFAETFFVPEVAFDAEGFAVRGPDGGAAKPDVVEILKTRTVVEHALAQGDGTYRFSTGPRHGALFRTWEVDGERESSRDPDVRIPDGAKVLANFQSLTLAETYVTAGAPTRTVLAPRGSGLELVALTHPNDLYLGESFEFEIRYDGAPLAGQEVEVTEAVWTSDREPATTTLVTDARGRARLDLDRAGTWIALTRHRTEAPDGAPVDEISNSYTLTFQVLEQ